MASPHHFHQPHLHQTHFSASCCCNGGFSTPCFQTHHPSPPPPTDPLLQALASHILQSDQSQHCTHNPVHTQKFQSHFQFQPPNRPKQKRNHHLEIQQVIPHSTISSLLSRIEALESRLHQVSSRRTYRPSYSLRDVAARTIQTHFRAFLVRRSRTFGKLKELAVIKSCFNSLKSSLSLEAHVDLKAVSLGTMDLLLDLDSIQGNDPMVRDSKRLISRDLVRFLEQIDSISLERNGLPLKAMKNLRLSKNVHKSRAANQKETIEKLKSRVDKICELSRIYENGGGNVKLNRFHHVDDDDDDEDQTQKQLVKGYKTQPRVKKSVRFAENGNLSRVLGDNTRNLSNEDGTVDESDSSEELVEKTSDGADEIKEFSLLAEDEDEAQGDGGSPETSDGERIPRRKLTHEAYYEIQDENGCTKFSAPLPVKMENKADLLKNRKSLKILG